VPVWLYYRQAAFLLRSEDRIAFGRDLQLKHVIPERAVDSRRILPQPATDGDGSAQNLRAEEVNVMNLASALLSRLRPRHRAAGEFPKACPADLPVPVLLAATTEADRLSIERLLSNTRYLPVSAATSNHAAKLVSQVVFPIVLFDPFAGKDWRPPISRLIGGWRAPAVLLISEAGEVPCCREWQCCVAFDIMIRPFEAQDVVSTLDLAYTKWTGGRVEGREPCRGRAFSRFTGEVAL